MRNLPLYLRWWLFAALGCLLGVAQAHPVCVVSSDRSSAYQEATDSLVQELVRSGVARQDILLMGVAEYQEAALHTADNKLIISLGSDALRLVMAQSNRTAVLAALIPRISFERVLQEAGRKNSTNVAALYLDQPFGRQLDLLRLALPTAHRIGVLWGPESVAQQPLLSAAAQSRGLDLSEGTYVEGQPLIGPLRAALHDADVLLTVADGAVYNPSSVSNILLTSYRSKTPVMGFSPAYVKAGALLSVHTTAAETGARVAALASHYLQSGNLPASQYPADYSITLNEYVARSLGLTLDAKALTERLHRLEKRP